MRLRTFGGLAIEAEPSDGPVPSLGPRRLALLAVVAAAGPRGITREKILGILWPESEEEHARHTLSQTLYRLRRETGVPCIAGTAQLRLDASLASDIRDFQEALDADDLARAAAIHAGPFLDGFYLTGAPEFERWVEETRARLQFAAVRALETLARRAVDAGSFAEAATWWRRLAEIEPFSPKYAAGRIQALIGGGDPGGALRFAREYESRVRRELDVDLDPVIAGLIAQLSAAPAAAPKADVAPPPANPVAVPVASVAQPLADAVPDAVEFPSAPRTGPVRIPARARWRSRASALVVVGLVTAALAWRIGGSDRPPVDAPLVLAIGSIQSNDTAATGPLLRDMLATNLARTRGIQVVSNSRLMELMSRSSDYAAGATADAARRAGAGEMVEGEVGVTPGGLVLTLRRVGLGDGVVKHGYTVRAADSYALTDSATAAIVYDLELEPPAAPVASAGTYSAIAYALYEQGLRSYYQGDLPATSRLMSAALDRDSSFAMAAFFDWLSNRAMGRLEEERRVLPLLRRLAASAADRDRLWVEGTIAEGEAPAVEFLRIAREMTDRFPADPDGQILLGTALAAVGDWAGAVDAFNRAIRIDSVAGVVDAPHCRVCAAIGGLGISYLWWDSVAAGERTANRLLAFRPTEGTSWAAFVEPMLRQGRRTEAEAAIARADKLSSVKGNFQPWLDRDLIRWGRSAELEARLVYELRTSPPDLRGERPWLLALSLRNQGRLSDAERLASEGILPGGTGRMEGHRDVVTRAIVALERGDPAESARRFLAMLRADRASDQPAGAKARSIAWHMALGATALAAAGDTAAVRALADSVERIGRGSNTGRDLRLHHFLHGLLLQHRNRHAEAVETFRRSLFSVTDGYTRTNLEMARSLMALRRHSEAIAILQAALRGGVDGSNTYITHTELHEALAHAFHAAGHSDSAAVHYAAVERAWRRADPELADRYRIAKDRATPVESSPED